MPTNKAPTACERCQKRVNVLVPMLCTGVRGYRVYRVCKDCKAAIEKERTGQAVKPHGGLAS